MAFLSNSFTNVELAVTEPVGQLAGQWIKDLTPDVGSGPDLSASRLSPHRALRWVWHPLKDVAQNPPIEGDDQTVSVPL